MRLGSACVTVAIRARIGSSKSASSGSAPRTRLKSSRARHERRTAGKVADVARMLKAIHAQEDRRSAEDKIREVMVKLRAMRPTKAAELVEAKAHETLTYFAFPSNHWRQIKTNNPLERISPS